jgi:flagellar hook-associated protein 2
MSLQVDGIISGLDTSALIEAILDSSGIPKTQLQARISDYEIKSERISDLVNRVATVSTALEDMAAIGDFRSYSASYTENDAFEIAVDGEAVEGSYDIEITEMAKAEQWVSGGFSASDTDAGMSGDLVFDYDGTSTTVATSGLSLEEIATEINDVDGLTAYVMNTGDATSPYRLVVQGDDRGSDYGIDFSSSDAGVASTLGFDDSANRTIEASSASLTINGVAVTSDGNTVADAVPGMTITITGTTSDAITVDVSSDPDAIEEKIQAFVDAYNDVVNFISTNSIYDSEEGIRGAFVGESGVRRVSQGMASVVTAEYADLSQDYESLGIIGIETTSSGMLEIDSDKFQEILLADPDQVADLFTSEDGFIAAMQDQLDVYTDDTEGSLSVRKDSIEQRITDLNDDVDNLQDRLDRMEARLRAQFTSMEVTMGQLTGSQSFILSLLSTTTTTA